MAWLSTKSFQRWFSILQRVVVRPETSVESWNLKPWNHINRCPKQMHNRFRCYCVICCSIPNSWQPDIRCYNLMTYVFCIHFFFLNQFWWRHMKNHMKHLARNSAKVLRWVATRPGHTTLAVSTTTPTCPLQRVGRRQNVGPGVELLDSAVICWSQMLEENHGWTFWKAKIMKRVVITEFEATEWFWIRVVITLHSHLSCQNGRYNIGTCACPNAERSPCGQLGRPRWILLALLGWRKMSTRLEELWDTRDHLSCVVFLLKTVDGMNID